MTKVLDPIHPGEILLEEFLEPMGITQYRLAKDISVTPRRINEIVHGRRSITADTALRLARYFGTSERFWMNLQARYDLEVEKERRSSFWRGEKRRTCAEIYRGRLLGAVVRRLTWSRASTASWEESPFRLSCSPGA